MAHVTVYIQKGNRQAMIRAGVEEMYGRCEFLVVGEVFI